MSNRDTLIPRLHWSGASICRIDTKTTWIRFINQSDSMHWNETRTYSPYVWRRSRGTHQQARVCCHCWMAAGSVASAVMVVAAAAGSWWSTGTGKDTLRVCSASSGPVEDCCEAGHGWRSSSQQWAKGALSTERAEAWRSWEAIGWTLAAVSVSGAGAVPPQHSRDAWWRSSVSPRLTQRFVALTL